jgi:hypothetical protein
MITVAVAADLLLLRRLLRLWLLLLLEREEAARLSFCRFQGREVYVVAATRAQ